MTLHGLYELSATLILLGALFMLTVGWAGIGVRCASLFNGKALSIDHLWIGLVFLVSAISALHLFMPISWLLRFIICGAGLAGLYLVPNLRGQVVALKKNICDQPKLAISISVAAVVLCLKGLQVTKNFDTGLYHLQTIRWLNEYAIVPGLGNLHGRLAFNQSYFNLLAFLNIEPWAAKGYVAVGIFLILLCVFSIVKLYKALDVGKVWVGFSLGSGLALTFNSLSAPAPDSAVTILQIYMFTCLIRFFIKRQSTDRVDFELLATIIFLSCFIITIKLSTLVFAVGSLVVLTPFTRNLLTEQLVNLKKIAGICFLFFFVHFLRGYILSGVPMYPTTYGALWSLPWAMFPTHVQGEAIWIYSWARLPGAMPSDVLGNWSWLKPWLANLPMYARILFSIDILLLFANVLFFIRQERVNKKAIMYSVYVPLISALIFWFFIAPDLRFLGAIPILLASLAGLLCLMQVHDKLNLKKSQILKKKKYDIQTIGRPCVGLLMLAISVYLLQPRSMNLRLAEPVPFAEVTQKTTNFGAMINIAKDGLCWANPLPCSPFVDDGLKLLNPSLGIGAGFTLK